MIICVADTITLFNMINIDLPWCVRYLCCSSMLSTTCAWTCAAAIPPAITTYDQFPLRTRLGSIRDAQVLLLTIGVHCCNIFCNSTKIYFATVLQPYCSSTKTCCNINASTHSLPHKPQLLQYFPTGSWWRNCRGTNIYRGPTAVCKWHLWSRTVLGPALKMLMVKRMATAHDFWSHADL